MSPPQLLASASSALTSNPPPSQLRQTPSDPQECRYPPPLRPDPLLLLDLLPFPCPPRRLFFPR